MEKDDHLLGLCLDFKLLFFFSNDICARARLVTKGDKMWVQKKNKGREKEQPGFEMDWRF